MSDSQSVNGGKQLFDNMNEVKQDESEQFQNPSDDVSAKSSQKAAKHKRIKKQSKDKKEKKQKKHKKEKKHKKAKQEQYDDFDDEQEQPDNAYADFFEDKADEDDEDEEQDLGEQNELQAYKNREELIEIYKQRTSGMNYLQKFEGKQGNQINAYYNREAQRHRQHDVMMPAQHEPKTYIVQVKVGRQEDLAYNILNKAYHLKDKENKVTIISALAMKKKFPGKLFVEAHSQKDIKDSLHDFIDINLSKIQIFDSESYRNLFSDKKDDSNDFKEGDYIRIRKGIYEQDLGKILKMKKNSVDVTIVPRINVQQMLMKMKDQARQITDPAQAIKRKDQIVKQYFNHRASVAKNMRPAKKQLYFHDIKELNQLPISSKIKLSANDGMIILNFRYDQIMKPKGTFLPIQTQYFSKDGKFIEEFENQKKHFISSVGFTKGEEVEVIASEGQKIHGKIFQVKDKSAIVKIRSKQSQGQMMELALDQLSKRFKQGQRVKVISGTNKGKTGIILKIDQKFAEIWTDNENTIKINKNNLQLHSGQVICEENVHGLKKDDLIKTSKNQVGIVLATRKDNIKILDTNNTIQVISNLDFDSKINSKALATKNRSGQLIKNQATVRIIKGVHEGQRCQVKHVFKEFAFVFNDSFDKTGGISVEKADNLSVISKNNQINRRNFQKNPNSNNQGIMANEAAQEELAVGKTIILKSGPLKGYQGIIRTVNKDRIQVRVPSKGCTEWVQRESVTGGQQNQDFGRTPHRGPSMTNQYATSEYNRN